jgi:hypothetical protein
VHRRRRRRVVPGGRRAALGVAAVRVHDAR